MIVTNDNARDGASADVDRCGRARPTLQNPGLDYAPIDGLVQANIDGLRTADVILADVEAGCADPDAAYLAVKRLFPQCSNANALAELRGFCRALQKRIEAGAE